MRLHDSYQKDVAFDLIGIVTILSVSLLLDNSMIPLPKLYRAIFGGNDTNKDYKENFYLSSGVCIILLICGIVRSRRRV